MNSSADFGSIDLLISLIGLTELLGYNRRSLSEQWG